MISFEVFDKSIDFYFYGLFIGLITCFIFGSYKEYKKKVSESNE